MSEIEYWNKSVGGNGDYKLLSCVCGGEAILCHVRRVDEDYCTSFRVECSDCGISTDDVETKEIAIKQWNEWVKQNG